MFFYSETSGPYEGPDLSKLSPNICYLNHFKNLMYLEFISAHSESTILEKLQAEKEIAICQRKLEFWKHRNGFDTKLVEGNMRVIRSQWKM